MSGWLVLVLCALTGLVSFGAGDWRRAGVLDRVADEERADLHDEMAQRLREGYVLTLTGDGESAYWRHHEVAEVRTVRPEDDPARPDAAAGRHVLPPAVPAAGQPQLDVPRPSAPSSGGPGHQRGYGPYLAAIGRDDPAGWYANLTAGEPQPDPGPPAEPAWLERMLYRGAVSTAWCEARITDAAEWLHEDAAAWDRFAARWADEARWCLVGARSWPPPSLEAAA